MKRISNLVVLTILSLSISINLYSQSTYNVTNFSNYAKYVQLDIATDPTVCNYYGGMPMRVETRYVYANGCAGDTWAEPLMVNEWVYKVGVLDETSCSGCSPTGSPYCGVAFSPCSSSSGSMNCCTSATVTADNTTYCDIN